MKWVILLSVLAGWLVTEIKDFFTGGAINNPLAITLLKIMFISVGILLVAFTLMTSHLLPKAIKKMIPDDILQYVDDNESLCSETTFRCNTRTRSRSPIRPGRNYSRASSLKNDLLKETIS